MISLILPKRLAASFHEATRYGIVPEQRVLDGEFRPLPRVS